MCTLEVHSTVPGLRNEADHDERCHTAHGTPQVAVTKLTEYSDGWMTASIQVLAILVGAAVHAHGARRVDETEQVASLHRGACDRHRREVIARELAYSHAAHQAESAN